MAEKNKKISVTDKVSNWKCRKCESFIRLTWERQRSKRIYFMCEAVVAMDMKSQDIENLEKCPIK